MHQVRGSNSQFQPSNNKVGTTCYQFQSFRMDMLGCIIGERAKRARHSQVCSIENRGYIYIYYIYIVRANFVLITRKEGGA